MIRNSDSSWGWPARVLHWVMAVLILFMLGLGLTSANLIEDLTARFELAQLHKSLGFVVFALAVARLLWRLGDGPAPAMPATMRPWERRAARVSHVALYVFMFAMPLTGWLMASASRLQDDLGVKNMVFGLFEMPDPFSPGSTPLADALAVVHLCCAIALMVALALHIGASFKNHFIVSDDVLKRMTLGR